VADVAGRESEVSNIRCVIDAPGDELRIPGHEANQLDILENADIGGAIANATRRLLSWSSG